MLPSVVASSVFSSLKLSFGFAASALIMPSRMRSCMTLSSSPETAPAAFSTRNACGFPPRLSSFTSKFFLDITFQKQTLAVAQPRESNVFDSRVTVVERDDLSRLVTDETHRHTAQPEGVAIDWLDVKHLRRRVFDQHLQIISLGF